MGGGASKQKKKAAVAEDTSKAEAEAAERAKAERQKQEQEKAAERHLRRPRAQTHAISGGRSSCEMTPGRGSRFEVNGSGPLPFRI